MVLFKIIFILFITSQLCSWTLPDNVFLTFGNVNQSDRKELNSTVNESDVEGTENETLLNKTLEMEFRGITFVGDKYCPEVNYESNLSVLSLQKLKATGANWVAIVVTEYQDTINSTEIYPLYNDYIKNDYYTYKTETLEGLRNVITAAHALGLQVMLKPHIDLSREEKYNETWRGDIGKNFTEVKQWDSWFSTYEKFILKYALLAEMLDVSMLSISCELIAVSKMDKYWRAIIHKVREAYSGKLIDSANHDGEEYNKTWWDELDYIGIDAYYLPIISQNLTAIQDHLDYHLNSTMHKLFNLSQTFNKDIIITEIGFCSGNCRIGDRSGISSLQNHYLQAYFYESFIRIFSQHKFIKGYFWWAWNSDPYYGGLDDICISPQHKMAEYILRRYYGGDLENVKYSPEKRPLCKCTI